MGNMVERQWESYERLAQVDFKCLENEIYKITSNSAKIRKNKSVPEKYKYKCKREEDVKAVLKKLFNIIVPTEDGCCDYIGECMGKKTEECKKCKGYWFTTDETFESYYKMWKQWKKDKNGMDPDDSDCKSNPFLRAIYYSLWGKRIEVGRDICVNGEEVVLAEKETHIYQYGFTRFRTSYLFSKMLWGGDTMNTLASYEAAINDSTADKDALSRKCHQLGNFVLVPAYFNQWRGRNKLIKDRMDLSLYRLSNLEDQKNEQEQLNRNNENDDNNFSFMEFFFTYWGKGRNAKTAGWNIVKEAFAGWSKSNFTKYINMFFLWDYVYVENSRYIVKNMWCEETKPIGNTKNENVDTYITKANRYIEKRGIFMAAMLKIAVEFDERKGQKEDNIWHVSAIYKYIVEKVFLVEITYSDYNNVIGAIKKAVRSKDEEEKIFDILDKAGELIENAANRLNNLEDGTC